MTLMPGAEPFAADGSSTGALVIHGFTGSPKSMLPLAQRLAAEGMTVRLPRLPGHGTRWQDMNLTRWEDWYAEVDRAFRELTERCDRVFVLGLSMGGSLTLRLAEEKGSAVAGIVLVNAAVHSERKDRHLLPLLQSVVPSFPGISNDIKKPGQDEGAYSKIPLKAAYSLSKLWTAVRQDIDKVNQPALVFRSAVDHVVEASNAEWIMSHVRSTDKTLVVLPDSYHVATLDNDAMTIEDASIAFIRRVSGQ
jgi:carboxylesterase